MTCDSTILSHWKYTNRGKCTGKRFIKLSLSHKPVKTEGNWLMGEVACKNDVVGIYAIVDALGSLKLPLSTQHFLL